MGHSYGIVSCLMYIDWLFENNYVAFIYDVCSVDVSATDLNIVVLLFVTSSVRCVELTIIVSAAVVSAAVGDFRWF